MDEDQKSERSGKSEVRYSTVYTYRTVQYVCMAQDAFMPKRSCATSGETFLNLESCEIILSGPHRTPVRMLGLLLHIWVDCCLTVFAGGCHCASPVPPVEAFETLHVSHIFYIVWQSIPITCHSHCEKVPPKLVLTPLSIRLSIPPFCLVCGLSLALPSIMSSLSSISLTVRDGARMRDSHYL